jgi:hypothetical protein
MREPQSEVISEGVRVRQQPKPRGCAPPVAN